MLTSWYTSVNKFAVMCRVIGESTFPARESMFTEKELPHEQFEGVRFSFQPYLRANAS